MAHTKNLGASLAAAEIDANHLGAAFIKLVVDADGNFCYERLDPASVLIKETKK